MITIKDLSQWLNQPQPSDAPIGNFHINSQDIEPGDAFVALPGQHADGHDYIRHAVGKGAIAILCERSLPDLPVAQFVVDNSAKALGLIARAHRQRLRCPVIALTGSNGKTTVKEMIANCLPPPSLATSGNLNNHLGVPLMVLRLNRQHRFAVFECGASHAGEIAYTTGICQPDIALVNNIAPAHIEGFGSLEGVAQAKGEIYQSLSANQVAIVNDDDAYAHFWDPHLSDKKVLRFSTEHDADVMASNIEYDANACARFVLRLPDGSQQPLQLQVAGGHMVANACAAASCLWAIGIEAAAISTGLAAFTGVAGRQSLFSGRHGARIIDDTYNANLRSVLAAIAVLQSCRGQRILVLGDMGELGDHSTDHHQQAGEAARAAGIECLLTVGHSSEAASQAFGQDARHFADKDALLEHLKPLLDSDTTVLIKGSRGAAMETLVAPLLTRQTTVEG